eukprot:m.261075 g.261075  ORF g.261075 m.261075 type:complete len:385 (-) comp41254_c0_seq1:82-1236(-)
MSCNYRNTPKVTSKMHSGMLAVLVALSCLVTTCNSHGFLSFPIARNWKARFDPASSSETEWCPHCLNGGGPGTVSSFWSPWPYPETVDSSVRNGVCGDPIGQGVSNQQKYAKGDGSIVANFAVGEAIDIEVVVTAHHLGYFQFHLCNMDSLADGENVSWSCLSENNLKRVSMGDGLDVSPMDDVRYFLDPVCAKNWSSTAYTGNVNKSDTDYVKQYFNYAQKMRMRYKLPDGLSCSHCVLRWHWVTANSCTPPDYSDVVWPTQSHACNENMTSSMWWNPSLGECEQSQSTYPEEFWNCADVSVGSTNTNTNVNINGNVNDNGNNNHGDGGQPPSGTIVTVLLLAAACAVALTVWRRRSNKAYQAQQTQQTDVSLRDEATYQLLE